MSADYFGLVKVGNKKVGERCAVCNMCAAHNCPSRKLCLCQLQTCGFAKLGYCYAFRDEKRLPCTLHFRRRQGKAWAHGIGAFVHTLLAIQGDTLLKKERVAL